MPEQTQPKETRYSFDAGKTFQPARFNLTRSKAQTFVGEKTQGTSYWTPR